MAKRTKSYGLNNPLQDVFPVPVVAQRTPTSNDTNYEIGQQWVDQNSQQVFVLTNVSGGVVWTLTGSGTTDLETLTGDTGGALSPSGGNINVLGGDGLTVDGSGSTLTINRDATGGYPITPFVVGPLGQAGYQTVQAGLDAANAAGGGTVYVQPGTFTENLTLYDQVDLWGAVGIADTGVCTITGVHTPPTSGAFTIRNIFLISATDIFNSAAAGTTTIILIDDAIDVTNGYTFNLVNWTGGLAAFDIGEIQSVSDGWINNTGGASVFMTNVTIGAGTGQTMVTSGSIELYNCVVGCPVDFRTGSTGLIAGGTYFEEMVTFSNDSAFTISNSTFAPNTGSGIVYNSSANTSITSSAVNSSTNPAIDGTGAGTLTLTSIGFVNDNNIAAALTIAGGNTKSGSFDTIGASTGINITDQTISSTGTGSDVDVVIAPKGIGNVDIMSNLVISQSGDHLEIEGGAVTDFIGQVTLVAGTVTVANTNISATDVILVTRTAVTTSTGVGVLEAGTITGGVSFVINSFDSTATIETNDVSTINYFIVRPL